jgi:DNA-binding NtrC family response regulator
MSLVPNSNRLTIVVIEGDTAVRNALDKFLRERGYSVNTFTSGNPAIRHIREARDATDLVFTDVGLTDATPLEVLNAARERTYDAQVVAMPSFAGLDAALAIMREGAFDYVIKPFKFTQIEVLLNKAAEHRRLREENAKLTERVQSLYDRLDHLKDNRERLDRFTREAFDKLDYQREMLEECLGFLRRKSKS